MATTFHTDGSVSNDGNKNLPRSKHTNLPEGIKNLYNYLGIPLDDGDTNLSEEQPSMASDNDSLDDLIDHLVFQEGTGPNGSGGQIRYWKNGKDISAKAALNKYVVAKQIEELEGMLYHLHLTGDWNPATIKNRIAKLKEIGS